MGEGRQRFSWDRVDAPAHALCRVAHEVAHQEGNILRSLAQRGAVLFYSMATRFQTAALTADGQSSDITMIVGNGFAPDCGAYALDLYRKNPALREALA